MLSIWRTSTSASEPLPAAYLFTPTMTCLPESMAACWRAEHSSIFSLGSPATMASVMPPMPSTSSISAAARRSISSVSASM